LELWGNLKDFSLPDVIQLVGFGRKSGVLGVEHNGSTAKLFFMEGNVVHAEMNDSVGEDAVFMLFRLGEGEFRFQAEAAPSEQTICMDPTNLVMEAARLLDESTRDDAEIGGEDDPLEIVEAQAGGAAEDEEATEISLPDTLPDIVFGGPSGDAAGESILGVDGDNDFSFLAEETQAEEPATIKFTPEMVRDELKAVLENKFGRESKRLLQAVEKCGDTEKDFQQLVKRVERFVSAFVDPKSASKIGEELLVIVSKLT